MASIDLVGQNKYAYDTTNPNLWGVFEIKFFDIWSGFCVKSVQTDRQTDTFPLYIYRFLKRKSMKIFLKLRFCKIEGENLYI